MSTELDYLRDYRNNLLRESDWTQAVDSPLSDSKKDEWKTYRQSLRDITKTASPKVIVDEPITSLDMSSVTWPSKP